jgi:hypothetical protein
MQRQSLFDFFVVELFRLTWYLSRPRSGFALNLEGKHYATTETDLF